MQVKFKVLIPLSLRNIVRDRATSKDLSKLNQNRGSQKNSYLTNPLITTTKRIL